MSQQIPNNSEASEYFDIQISELTDIVEEYQNRTFDEDLTKINGLGGLESICKKLKTNIDDGLNSNNEKDLDIRQRVFSKNSHEEEEEVNFCDLILESFEDPFIQILIVAAIVQISIGLSPLAQSSTDWIDGMAIVFAIIIVVITSSVTNYSKELKFRELSKQGKSMFSLAVLRNKKTEKITSEDLLVGDIVKLEYGMILPVDGILISGESVSINESSITGESLPVFKESHSKCLSNKIQHVGEKNNNSIPSPILISSTTVESGTGWFLVIAVGKNSVKGKINTLVFNSKTDENNKTPLELKLSDIADDIGKFGYYSASLTFIALTLKLIYSKYREYKFHTAGLLSENTNNYNSNNSYGNSTNSTYYNNTNVNDDSQFMEHPSDVFSGIHKDILTILMLCVAIIVVAIPEGLPLAVTLALSFSVRKMMEDNNLVRHLSACETMGGANYILTDKTGTLTMNKMAVRAIFNNERVLDLSHVKSNKEKNIKNRKSSNASSHHHSSPTTYFSERYYQILKEAIIGNTDVEVDENGEQIRGNKTDFSLYELISDFGEDCVDFKNGLEIKERLPFHSDRKKMSTLLNNKRNKISALSSNANMSFVHMKGAVEYIINSCDSYIHPDTGEKKSLDKKTIDEINKAYDNFSENAYRSIGIAYKEVSKEEAVNFKKQMVVEKCTEYLIEQEKFTFIGLFGIADPFKENVPKAVLDCKSAGINVIMITGDHVKTAVAIAKQTNILNVLHEESCLTGAEFYTKIKGIDCNSCKSAYNYCKCKTARQLKIEAKDGNSVSSNDIEVNSQNLVIGDIDAFKHIMANLKILARARPIDKFAMVLGLKELDNVVAVTGDGSNDAQALSKADVGFSMGKEGTEAAKNASDIIILDDNFASIVSSIKWGRSIFDNIRKFLQFQLSVNLSAVLLVFVTSCIGSESPISAIQMLWLNLIMDSLGSLALATEAPTDELLLRKPYSKREYLIDAVMWKHIIAQSIVQFSVIFFLYIYADKFIIEEDINRIKIYSQLEHCFGDFSAANVKYQRQSMLHYIINGRKSSWNPLHLIKQDLSPEYCMFYDTNKFEPNQVSNLEQAYKWYVSEFGNTTHMTIVFNCFVLYSLFNQINSRILDQSLNIFKRITENWIFLVVIIVELLVQVLLVETGGIVFKCIVGGLTSFQWIVCVAFASITFWVSIFAKFVTIEKFGNSKIISGSSRRLTHIQLKDKLIEGENMSDDLE